MNVPDVTPEPPPGRWRATLALLARLPQGALSRAFGRVADLPVPRPLRPAVIGGFARALGIDAAEAEHSVVHYRSLNDFFVRRLRAGVRSWPSDPDEAASPVDGVLGQLGTVTEGALVQAKGRRYTVARLLDDEDAAAAYEGGVFLTLYLSPRHYHRIHTPCPGSIPLARHVPGALLPVNAAAVAHVPELFARNERMVCYVEAEAGGSGSTAADHGNGAGDSGSAGAAAANAGAGRPSGAAGAAPQAPGARPASTAATSSGLGRVAVVAIGAYNVGRISAAFDPAWRALPGRPGWVTNRRGARAEARSYQPPVPVAAGQEIMAFHLGSTVVLLFRRGVALAPGLEPGQEVRVGQVIARA